MDAVGASTCQGVVGVYLVPAAMRDAPCATGSFGRVVARWVCAICYVMECHMFLVLLGRSLGGIRCQ